MQQKNKELQQRFTLFDKRLRIWQFLTIAFCVGLIIHLFFMQVVDLKHYRQKAKRQRSANSSIMRGTIVDANDISNINFNYYITCLHKSKAGIN